MHTTALKCMIPGSNIKVFGRSIHCLSKIGEDLYIEPLEHGLALRTVNSSRSAYACFLFAPSFFLSYVNGPLKEHEVELEDDAFRCRITMKSCLSVFKSLSSLEKTVDKCQMYIDLEDCRLVFLLHCKHGIVKTFNLTYQETESLQAVFSKDLCPNHIIGNSKSLIDVVNGFQTSQDEITLSVTPQQVSFKNYVEDEADPNKVVHSEMFLSPEEFDDYGIGIDAEVTFCLKELRAVLTFADAAGLPISMHFESSGKPIVFAMESEKTLEATFVLATLADIPSSQSSSQARPPSSSQHRIVSHSSRHSQRKATCTNEQRERNAANSADDLQNRRNNEYSRKSDITAAHTSQEHASCGQKKKSSRLPTGGSSSPVIPMQMENNKTGRNQDKRPRLFPDLEEHHLDNEETTQIPPAANMTVQNSEKKEECGIECQDKNGPDDRLGDSEDFDFIPGTPPNKKFKSMFFGMSQQQASQSTEPSKGHSAVVLCEDTDSDDSDA